MTLLMEGFERFPVGVISAGSLTERNYDTLGAQIYSGVVEESVDTGFSSSISISADGNTLIVGSFLENDEGHSTGAAYIFTRNGTNWSRQARLTASDGVALDQFGYSVSISADGNTAIIGAHGDDSKANNAGAAYIFTRTGSTWSEQTKLTASDGAAGDNFGYSVSISADGNTVVVGARWDDSKGDDAGAAYIFNRSGTTWSQQAKLTASDGAANDNFGESVTISADGNTVVVGAPLDDDKGANSGSLYVFTRPGGTWSQQAKLVGAVTGEGFFFGRFASISADGNTVVTSMRRLGDDAALVYVFTRNGGTWSQQAILTFDAVYWDVNAPVPVSLSADGNTMIVGSPWDGDNNDRSGSAHIFTRSGTTWSQQAKLVPTDGAAGDWFGRPVVIAADGGTVAIGAYYMKVGNAGAYGAVCVFTKPGGNWDEQIKLTGFSFAPDPSAGTLTISGIDANVRGTRLNYSRTTIGENPHMAAARFKLPDNAWVKRIVGFALRLNAVGSATTIAGFGSDVSPNQSFVTPASISVQTSAPYLRLNATPFSQAITLGEWGYIELMLDRTAGTCKAYLNGQQVASTVVSSAQFDNIGRFVFEIEPDAENHNFDIDDFYYLDDVDETLPIEPIGMCKVDLMPANSVVSANFIPQPPGVTTLEALAPPLDPDTYVTSSTEGEKDVLKHGFIGGGPADTDEVLRTQAVSVVKFTNGSNEATVGVDIKESKQTVTVSGETDETAAIRVTTHLPLKGSDLADIQSGYAVGSEW